MAPTEANIKTLLGSPSYSPSMVSTLEDFVAEQVSGATPYNFDANRVLIKLYQLFPSTVNESKIADVFFLALTSYPSTDLLALSYMIPSMTLSKEPFQTIQACGKLLESCKFSEFWELFASIRKDEATTKQLQMAILDVLSLSYKRVPANIATGALKISSVEEINAWNHPAVEMIEADSAVAFVSTSNNTHRERVYQEGVNFTAVSALLSNISQ